MVRQKQRAAPSGDQHSYGRITLIREAVMTQNVNDSGTNDGRGNGSTSTTPSNLKHPDLQNALADPLLRGMECDIKNLYQGPEDNRGRFNWLDTLPADIDAAVEDEETAKFAILVRKTRCYNDSRKVLEIDSLVIQSPLLKEALGEILKDYPGMYILF